MSTVTLALASSETRGYLSNEIAARYRWMSAHRVIPLSRPSSMNIYRGKQLSIEGRSNFNIRLVTGRNFCLICGLSIMYVKCPTWPQIYYFIFIFKNRSVFSLSIYDTYVHIFYGEISKSLFVFNYICFVLTSVAFPCRNTSSGF